MFGTKRQAESKALAFLGFDPLVRESGKWKAGSRMTKRGDRMARTALFQSAACALKHVPELKAYYERKREEGKSQAVAISHVMRRQLRRQVAVLYDRKAFVRNIVEELPQPLNLNTAMGCPWERQVPAWRGACERSRRRAGAQRSQATALTFG